MSDTRKTSNIVITGMPACGKSTVSKLLASSLNMKLADLDFEIEKSLGMSITKVFEKYGEDYFRAIEKKLLKDFLKEENILISSGGGIVKDPENIKIMHENATVIFLNVDIDTLCDRIKNDKSRPLLNCEDQKTRLKKLYDERIELYKTADIEVDGASEMEKTVEEIKRKLKR